jgi:hypothetical protein
VQKCGENGQFLDQREMCSYSSPQRFVFDGTEQTNNAIETDYAKVEKSQ